MPKKTQSKKIDGSTAAAAKPPAPAKSYQLRETASTIRAVFSVFAKVHRTLLMQRRMYLAVVVIVTGLLWFVWEVLGKNSEYELIRLIWEAFLVLGLAFVLLTAIPRRIWLHKKLGIPVFRGSGGGFILFGVALFVVPMFLEMLYAGFDSSIPTHAVLLHYLKQGTSLSLNPQPVLIAGGLSALSVWVLLLFLKWIRLGRIMPQDFESYFIASIIDKLSAEVPPDERISVSMNPFPVEWSEETKTIGGRTAHFDQILDCKLPLGGSRRFSFTVLHRRTSKGSRKHKGYKHKIKFKYCLSGNAKPIPAVGASAFKRMVHTSLDETRAREDASKKKDSWNFQRDLSEVAIIVEPRGDGSLVVVQTFTVPCVSRKDLKPRDLIHPDVVLTSVRAMSELYLVSAPPSA